MPTIRGIHVPKESNVKNYIINGDMAIAQRATAGSAVWTAIADNTYSLDRLIYQKTGAMVHTLSQDTDVPTLAQAGYLFQNSLRLNLTTADTSIAAIDYCVIDQRIEGYNFAQIAQKPFTLSFWVKATLTGTYCVSFVNSGNDRSYIAEYTINSSATWEKKTITVTASPSAGTWNYTNGKGVTIYWTLACGSTFQTTSNSWQTGNFIATANQVNGVNTGATDFRITGVMLNEGTVAAPFQLFGGSIDGEIEACQRYYEKSYNQGIAPGTDGHEYLTGGVGFATNVLNSDMVFKALKRATPTATIYAYDGTSGSVSLYDAAGNMGATGCGPNKIGTSQLSGIRRTGGTAFTVNQSYWFHWVAESEL